MDSRKIKIAGLTLAFIFSALAATAIAFAQTNRTPRPQQQSDFKVTYKVSMRSAGNDMPASESTTMIKGARQRSEDHRAYGGDSVNITQCDLKRSVQLNDKTRKYMVTPLETTDSAATAATPTPATKTPSRRGGVITYITSSRDTGERKEMFGFSARHVKTATRVESSADACNPVKQRFEQDGWYIDLSVAFNCDLGRPMMAGYPGARGGCQDRMQTRREGAGRTGFPLIETTTVYDENDQPSFSMTKEVVDLSRQSLDAALFDVPTGYTEARDWQDMNGQPDANAMMAEAMAQAGVKQPGTGNDAAANTPSNVKQPGAIRIGVVQINNRTSNAVSAEELRQRLIANIVSNGLEAVPLNGSSATEADIEAKSKQCDFVLYSDIASMKLSAAKALGGMLGRATGVSSGLGKTEAKLEFRLVPVGGTAPRLQSTATAKEEGDDASAGAAIDAEARAVSSAAKKKS